MADGVLQMETSLCVSCTHTIISFGKWIRNRYKRKRAELAQRKFSSHVVKANAKSKELANVSTLKSISIWYQNFR